MKKLLITLLVALISTLSPATAQAEEVYRDNSVRFTLIDEGTIRLEYAPDGKFVDNKSFVAVIREYGEVPHKISTNGGKVVITTSKFKLTYKKDGTPLNAKNLIITSAKTLDKQFTWTPGTEQKGNLKGTYRTLDGYDGNMYQYSNPKHEMPLENGLLATDGWTLIDDSKNYIFDGAKDWDWVTERKSAEGAQDWYFMAYGRDYKGALLSFTKFAGKVPLPPRYTFGYWWSRYWSYSDQDLRDLISNFHRFNLPLDVLVIDMDWHPNSKESSGGWTGWDWNERIFPDYKKFLVYLDEQGVKTTMNLHPAEGVRPYEKKYNEFMQRFGKNDGKTYEWMGSDKKYVKALFDTYLHQYVDEGVDFWWLDWQQWEKDRTLKDLDNVFWCNYIWFTDMENNGTKRPLLYHRWGGLGNHRYQIGFSGDSYATWESLSYLPYFNSTSANVLYGYWSHDIGGHQVRKYGMGVDPELYTRAMQMGQYLPILRSHSAKDPSLNKEPWAFDQVTQRRLTAVINGRYALIPYIYTMARKTYDTGVSLCRPLYYDYPNDPFAYSSQHREEYMFGDNMLIAPITKEVNKEDGYAHLKVWLPEGEWLEYETGQMLQGNDVYGRCFTLDEYPVYVKAGSILPYYGKVKNLSGTEQPVIVRVFPGSDKDEFTLYEDNGEDKNYATEYAITPLSYQRSSEKLSVTIGSRKGQYKDMPAHRDYTLALPCQKAPNAVTVDGKKVNFFYDGLNLETNIALGSIDCSKGATIEVTFPTADYAVINGEKGKFHRIQNAVQDYKQHDANMVYTEAFGYLEATPLRLYYHPENQQETLDRFQKLYKKLPVVLVEQMGKNANFDRFMRQLGEDDNMLSEVSSEAFSTAEGTGFALQYFPNKELHGEAKAFEHVEKIDMFFSGSPTHGIPADYWSMTAESTFTAPETGDVMFIMSGDDAYRLIIDGKEIFSDWGDHAETTRTATISVEAGKKYDVRIEFYDNEYNAILQLQTLMIK